MPQIVAAVGAVFASASAWYAGLGVIGKAFIQIAGSVVLSGFSAAMQKRRQQPLIISDRGITVRAPVSPREIVYGKVRKGGVIVFVHQTTSPRRNVHMVIALAAHRVQSIGAIYFDGELAIDAIGWPQGRWTNMAQVEKSLGADDAQAFPLLIANAPDKWTPEHRLQGIAAIYLRFEIDQPVFANGIPNITVEMEGKNDILDPRTNTRGYTRNWALCVADYMSLPRFGLGARIGDPDGIDEDSLIEAANISDEAVPLDAGGAEPRYRCDGVVSLATDPQANIRAMLTAGAGQCVWQGGAWRILAGAWRPPAVTLTDDDAKGRIATATRISMAQNFNGVRGQFVSPENDWQPDDYPAYQSAVYVAEDGGEERWRDLALPFTTSATAAQRLAKIHLERTRRQMSVQFPGKLSAWRVATGDTVALTRPRLGWSAKPFEVAGLSLEFDPETGATPTLTLRETSPLVWDWDATEEQIYAAAPRTTLPSALEIAQPGTPLITEELFATRDGTGARVLLRVEWAEAAGAVEYEVEARRIADTAGDPTGEDWLGRGRTANAALEIRDVQPGRWQVRVIGYSAIGVRSESLPAERNVLGLSVPPQALLDVSLQTAGGVAILKWQRSRDLDVRIGGNIVVRHSAATTPTWENSISMDTVAGADAIAVVPLKPGTYFVRARDSSGNYGPTASVVTKGAQALAFAPLTTLTEDPTFAGAKTNAAVTASTLRLTDVAAPGLYDFGAGMDFGTVKPVRLRSDIRLTVVDLTSTVAARTANISTWPSFSGGSGAEVDCVVEARFTDDNPSGSPVWTEWERVDSSEIEARAVQARARLSSSSADYNLAVNRLRLVAEEVA